MEADQLWRRFADVNPFVNQVYVLLNRVVSSRELTLQNFLKKSKTVLLGRIEDEFIISERSWISDYVVSVLQF